MEKYRLIRKESKQLYAKLEISIEDILFCKKDKEYLYSTIIEWIRNLTSGEIILTPEDFEMSGTVLFMKSTEGKNYGVRTSLELGSGFAVIIYRKVNPYSITHV